MSHSNGSGGKQYGLGIMTKANHKVWCGLLNADLQKRGYLEVCKFGPMHEQGLAAVQMQLVSVNQLADGDRKAAQQVEARAKLYHQNGHAQMILALGIENEELHLDPNTKTGVQLYAAIQALFGATDKVNMRAANALFWDKAKAHKYVEGKATAGAHIGECHNLFLLAKATGSRTTEWSAFDGIVNGMSPSLEKEQDDWHKELDGMGDDATVLPAGSWARLKLGFEREETKVHHKRAAKRAEKVSGGGKALATTTGESSLELKEMRREIKELRALATVSKTSAGDCYNFKDTGKCGYGDRCKFSHAGGDGGRGGGGRNKLKAGSTGPCFQFKKMGSCKRGDRCRYSHADGSADGEQDSD
jgi:hypothetical protein